MNSNAISDAVPLHAEPGDAFQATRKRLILIVDDVAENLQVLAGHLTAEGYEVMAASNGQRALAFVWSKKPDLILLDVMMPGMDGLAVCRELKADPESAEIPVVFLTARAETDDIVRGFELGAADYITKPFKAAELLARVRTQLELKAAHDLIATYNQQLERLSAHLRRLNEDKNRFLSIVSHDIRSAFSNVITVSRLLTNGPAPAESESGQLLSEVGVEAEHMISLAENLLNIDAIERHELRLGREAVSVRPLLNFATQAHQMAARAKSVGFVVTCDDLLVEGDRTACRQILANLVSNAVKHSPVGGKVHLDARLAEGGVRVTVRDEGEGILPEDMNKLFKPFLRLERAKSNEHSIGLGLSIVKMMVEGMNGRVHCESIPGQGATFIVALPAGTARSLAVA